MYNIVLMLSLYCNQSSLWHWCHTIKTYNIHRLLLPGELRKHAILEGEKAVKTYQVQAKQLKESRIAARGDKKGVFPGKRKKSKKHANEQDDE